MRPRNFAFALAVFASCTLCVFSQGTVVVNDPTKEDAEVKLSATQQALFDSAMPAVKKAIMTDTCNADSIDVAGVANGAFSKAGAKQTLIFYQFCQTGNGFGWVGLVLIEDGKVVGSYVSDSSWTVGIGAVPDINQNGLDEFTLEYSGGMHQGQGGVGVDLMEFAGGIPKGIGWYKAEEFADTEAVSVWKLTAKPGPVPVFYKQKYFSGENSKYRKVGANAITKLTKVSGKFTVVK
ncbi:MAG: hypothetical protein QM785_02810 [Pyrinomonadaceae bacterium]